METKKDNTLKKILIGVAIAVVLFISIPFGAGLYTGIKMHTGVTGQIETTISKTCKCESVKSDFSAVGFQFSKEDGMSNKKSSYVLTNCEFEGLPKDEAIRIHQVLKAEVEGYETIDFISLTFKNNASTEVVKIKDGKIL